MRRMIYVSLWGFCLLFWLCMAIDFSIDYGHSFLYSCDTSICGVLHELKKWLFAPAVLITPLMTLVALARWITIGKVPRLEVFVLSITWILVAYFLSFVSSS